ncbi:MAG TPA: AraC family transcriptional regulator [Microscillaceae bacterium]|nr:AraC family transcriptional regulator [Microscillaceae bacterium]
MEKINVGIFIFDEVEVLDFAGPFEVFAKTVVKEKEAFQVSLVSAEDKVVNARYGFRVLPDVIFESEPVFDVLIVPGGFGAEVIEIKNEVTINWLKNQQEKVSILASVCTGALLLAEAGILDGKRATTHWMDVDRLEKEYPRVNVERDIRFIDEGHILTSGGISAGIDMSLHIVERFFGKEIADTTAKKMEYDRKYIIQPEA